MPPNAVLGHENLGEVIEVGQRWTASRSATALRFPSILALASVLIASAACLLFA
jgi:hypothetical protein